MALKPREVNVVLDVAADYHGDPIWAVQGESNSQVLQITLQQEGAVLDVADTTVTFKYRTPDGNVSREVLGTSTYVKAAEAPGSITVVTPAEAFLLPGEVHCEIIVQDSINKITVKTPTFKLFVLESIMD